MIGEREVEGVRALTLSSEAAGGVEVAFAPGGGMIGCSLRHRGEELLGQRGGLRPYLEAGKTMGIPLLYPWANRLGGRRFEVAGGTVDLELPDLRLATDAAGLPMHGLLAGAAGWQVERHETSADGGVLAARFDFSAQPLLIEAFPFPHQIGYEATLDGPKLTIAISIRPSGEVSVPVAFGFHPYLRLPDVPRDAWELEIPVTERLLLDERMLPTGRTDPVEVAPGPLGARTFDDAFRAPPDGAPFVLAGGGRRLELRLGEGYRYSQVYAPAEDDVIAFEPMTAPADALRSGHDLPLVAPEETFKARFTLTIT
ncbi:MAG TPA: aldose 1-epimerase [Solirubrobacterales bacterium]|nr:aldose 1-epimerase [Solirubrobacterales bacterium]